jgi:death-on-curing protein
MNLLQSAVFRQHTGVGNTLKYPGAVENAASLTYGICCNHPFHNGNKRAALVAMLVHLDRNRLVVRPGTSHSDLFDLILAVAQHSLGQPKPDPRKKRTRIIRLSDDEEVREIAVWIKNRFRPIVRGEKPISYYRLRQILQTRGFHIESQRGNSVEIVRYIDVERGFFKKRIERVRKHVLFIAVGGDSSRVPMKTIKKVREVCKLREEDGVDTSAFYNDEAVIDVIINEYRTLLRKLARR